MRRFGASLMMAAVITAGAMAQEEAAPTDTGNETASGTSDRTSAPAAGDIGSTPAVARSDFARRQQLAQVDEDLKAAQQAAQEWDAVADAVEAYHDGLPKVEQYTSLHGQLIAAPVATSTNPIGTPSTNSTIAAQQLYGLVSSIVGGIDFTDDELNPIARSRDVTTATRRLVLRLRSLAPKAHAIPIRFTGGGTGTIEALRSYTPQQFQAERDAVAKECADFIQTARENAEKRRKEVTALRNRRAAILYEIDKPRVEINELAIKLGLPLFCSTVVILFCIPLVVRQFGTGQDTRSIFTSGILIEINTILLLTMSILILGLADKMKGEVLGTLLGGISGYVLNRIRERRAPPPADSDQPVDAVHNKQVGPVQRAAGENDAEPPVENQK